MKKRYNSAFLIYTKDIVEGDQIMSVAVLQESEFDTAVKKADGLVLVDFYADWCGPCKMLAPVIAELAEEHPEVHFFKVNIDENAELAAQYGVMSIPTVVLIKGGETLAVEVGVRPKSSYAALIEQHR